MTLKNAALLALIGTILMTVLLVWKFVFDVLNALQGLVPAITLFSSFIYAFGCLKCSRVPLRVLSSPILILGRGLSTEFPGPRLYPPQDSVLSIENSSN